MCVYNLCIHFATDDSNRIKLVSYEDSGNDYVNASPVDVCVYIALNCYIKCVTARVTRRASNSLLHKV